MLITDWFTFAGVPKTGCCWFKDAMAAGGIALIDKGQHELGHEPGKPSVTIRRDPASWLMSYWANINGKVSKVPILDRLSALRSDGDTLEGFIQRYVKEWPGGIETIFAQYAANHTLHTDRLNDDFGDLLAWLAVPCDIQAVRDLPPANVTAGKRKIPVTILTDELCAEIRKAA